MHQAAIRLHESPPRAAEPRAHPVFLPLNAQAQRLRPHRSVTTQDAPTGPQSAAAAWFGCLVMFQSFVASILSEPFQVPVITFETVSGSRAKTSTLPESAQ